MARRTKKAAVELNPIDDRTIMVAPLYRQSYGDAWFAQADYCDPATGERVVYAADGPFDDVREAIANGLEQAALAGWEPGSFMLTVDE